MFPSFLFAALIVDIDSGDGNCLACGDPRWLWIPKDKRILYIVPST